VANLSVPMAVMELTNGATIRLEAVDPTTGNAVTGVKVSNIAITALDLSDDAGVGVDNSPAPMLVPTSV
jgi:hypothetical protein